MRTRSLRLILIAAAWAVGALFWWTQQRPPLLLDHDEVYWIGSAYYYELALVRHDFDDPAWGWLPARENPPVCKYVIGLGLHLAGHHIRSIESLSYFYLNWLRWEQDPFAQPANATQEKRAEVVRAAGADFRQRILEVKRAPLTRPVVTTARQTIAVCAALGSLGLLVLGLASGEWLGGLIASQLFLFHPTAADTATRAMSDMVACLFLIAAAGATLAWYQRAREFGRVGRGTGAPWTLLTGVLLGLACAAKMNAIIIVLVTALMVAFAAGEHLRAGRGRAAAWTCVHGIVIAVVGLLCFVAVNPAIWNDFPGAIAATVTEHRETEAAQIDLRQSSPTGFTGKLQAVVTMGFFGWTVFLAVLGVIAWAGGRSGREPALRFVVCWWIVALICVTAWLPFAWPRYVLPLLPPTVLLVGYAAAAFLRAVRTAVLPASSPQAASSSGDTA